jgi:Outer membrane protein beta-barrel domain
MKKFFFVCSVLATASVCTAQTIGLQAGLNLASQTIGGEESGGFTISTSSRPGFLIGAVAQFPLSNSITFRPELNYIQKGSKTADEASDQSVIIALNYLDLPLNFTYSSDAGKGQVFFGAGPTIGLGLSGYTKVKAGSEIVSTDIKFDGKSGEELNDGYGHLKAIDIGFNLLAGYYFSNGLFADAGYTFGLGNVSPEAGSSLKNDGFFIKLGYCFGDSGRKRTKK